jgi:DNA-binding beta-propeller fold protein YncE
MLEQVADWPRLPPELDIVEAPGVAVDSRDRVFVLTRNPESPIIVLGADGVYETSFGQGTFTTRAHGLSIGPDDCLYCADDGRHTVTKFSPEGELLMTIGVPDLPAPRWSGQPFCRPTHATPSPVSGDIFVSDGYGNARVHRFTAEGEHVLSWGSSGIDPGQFIIPHDVLIDEDEHIYVADREANRIQVFEPDGELLEIFYNVHRPDGLAFGLDGSIYVAELSPAVSVIEDAPGAGHRISVLSRTGELLWRFGAPDAGEGPSQFIAPHGIAVDSTGDVYVAEVSWTIRGRNLDPPRQLRSLSRLHHTTKQVGDRG